MPKRSWTKSEKAQCAASNGWRCGACKELLPSAFDIDHVVGLADGGADDIHTNAVALCPGCHRLKTQREIVARVRRRREAAEQKVRADLIAFELRAYRETKARQRFTEYADGTKRCELCNQRFYAIFSHDKSCSKLKSVVKNMVYKYKIDHKMCIESTPLMLQEECCFDRFLYTENILKK